MKKNSPAKIAEYLSVPEKPIEIEEFWTFWLDLTPEEREYYQTVELV